MTKPRWTPRGGSVNLDRGDGFISVFYDDIEVCRLSSYTPNVLYLATLIAAAPKMAEELDRAHKIILRLWTMMMEGGIKDDAGWPSLRELERVAILSKIEGGQDASDDMQD